MTARKNTTARNAKTDEAKLKAKATVIDNDTGEVHESAWTRFAAAQDELFAELGVPSGKRLLAASIASVVVGAGVGWLIGWVINALTLGVLIVSSSLFLSWLVYILGLILAVIAGLVVGKAAAAYIVTGKIDEHARTVRGWFKGIFGRSDDAKVVTA